MSKRVRISRTSILKLLTTILATIVIIMGIMFIVITLGMLIVGISENTLFSLKEGGIHDIKFHHEDNRTNVTLYTPRNFTLYMIIYEGD